nr:Wzz/FepE/Etk N-terminal domain-containing protein [Bifidobacterium animalis]
MTIADLLGILRKHIITIVVTFAVILGVDILYTAMSPVEYTTNTQLFATYNSSNDSANSSEQYSGSSYIMSQIKSYPQVAKTQSVLQPVVEELKLSTTTTALASQITVTNPTNTAFVNIAVTDADPSAAARIANSAAASLSNVVEKSLYTAGSNSAVKLSVVQPAQVPAKPSSPKWSLNLLAGILGGLIIGILAALLKDVLSKKIQDENDVTDIVDAPIIGRVVKADILAGSSPVVVSEPEVRLLRISVVFVPVFRSPLRWKARTAALWLLHRQVLPKVKPLPQ